MGRHIWTEEEHQFLKDNVKGITLKELTIKFNKKFNFNVTENAINGQKAKLNLKSGIVGGQFQRGCPAYNKGKRWKDYMSEEGQENARKATFKKGNVPANSRPIGSERLDKDGYIQIKVADPNTWVPKHRYLYEQEYGKIPNGYCLIFLDGNKQNMDLSNLKLISRSEGLIMNRKKLFAKNKELTESGVLIAKVIDKTNKLKRR